MAQINQLNLRNEDFQFFGFQICGPHKLEAYAGNDDEEAQSQSYSKSVTDSTSNKFSEKLSVKAGFKIKLANIAVTAELSAEQMFTKTTTHTQ